MKRQLIISVHLLLLLITVSYFWTQSRYPALDDKAYYGERNRQTGISYDEVVKHDPKGDWGGRVWSSTINWYYTNWKGMTFGLIFAALLMSLFNFIKVPQFKNRWLRAGSGALFGAPLGVCVNCATPIGQGLQKSGMKSEFVIASTLSSPTLNIVVLSLLIAHFPLHFVALKIFATLVMVFLILPFITPKLIAEETSEAFVPMSPAVPRTYLGAGRALLRSLYESGLRIFILTVPLMILSGLIGSAIVESIDVSQWTGAGSWYGLILISLVGTLLPVPMTFDIVFAHKLLETDMPTAYVAALLSTLGVFSIYPFLVFGRAYSWKFAGTLGLAVVVLGAGAGFATEQYEQRLLNSAGSSFKQRLLSQPVMSGADRAGEVLDLAAQYCHGADQDRCRLALVRFAGKDDRASALCAGISDQALSYRCEIQIALVRGRLTLDQCKSEPDPRACELMFYKNFSSRSFTKELEACSDKKNASANCNQMRSYLSARGRSAIGSCKRLESNGARDACLLNAAKSRIERDGHEAALRFCKYIGDPSSRTECETEVLVLTGDEQLCLERSTDRVRCWVRLMLSSSQTGDATGVCSPLGAADQELCEGVVRTETALQIIAQKRALPALVRAAKKLDSYEAPEEEKVTAAKPAPWDLSRKPELKQEGKIGAVSVSSFAHRGRGAAGKTQFERVWGRQVGLVRSPIAASEYNFFSRGFGVSSGDFNGDYWPDVALGDSDGIHIYMNKNGSAFEKIADLPLPRPLVPVNLSFVDFNNDGWEDLYVANFDGRIFIVENSDKGFVSDKVHILSSSKRGWPVSAAFGDFNKDGFVDIFLGNSRAFARHERVYLSDQSANEVLLNSGKFHFESVAWKDDRGATLANLASDINQDGNLDLLEANDFEATDAVWLGAGNGDFDRISRLSGLIPKFTFGSMGFETADFNNDLILDIFSAGINRGTEIPASYCEVLEDDGLDTSACRDAFVLQRAIETQTPRRCESFKDPAIVYECYSAIIARLASRTNNADACSLIPADFVVYRFACEKWFDKGLERRLASPEDIPQQHRGNLLLMGLGGGKFTDVSPHSGLSNTHWAWSSKFADVDNDGWQDFYSVNGRMRLTGIGTNMFFFNRQGGGFEEKTSATGLTDYYDTTSLVYIDYDLDGDLDILINGNLVDHRLYNNGLRKGNSISFSFEDYAGNRGGIGNKLIIRYRDKTGKPLSQIRELKQGGGYASYDPKSLHFGLGENDEIESAEVEWSTGKRRF